MPRPRWAIRRAPSSPIVGRGVEARAPEAAALEAGAGNSRAAREALAPLLAAKGDWAGWIAEREALAAIVAEPEKASLWEEIGDACGARLGDRARAEAAYRKAFEAEPDARAPIEKLLAIYKEESRFEQAVEMLAALAKAEPSPAERAKLRREAARLLLDKVNRPLEAVELLERALDDAPEMIDAFDELSRLREDAMDWAGLVASHRAMLERLPPGRAPPAPTAPLDPNRQRGDAPAPRPQAGHDRVRGGAWPSIRATTPSRRRWPTSISWSVPTRASAQSPPIRS